MQMILSNPFLETLPTQRRVWSASSIATAMACWRKYLLATVYGYESAGARSVDLDFGSFIHAGSDVYLKACASGADAETATELAYEHVLAASQGWGGEYRNVWRCDGKVKGDKGRAVKCPSAKQWNDGDGECRYCGQTVPVQVVYFPDDPIKNRRTLLRSLVAYCDALTASHIRPIVLPDGRIGSELAFAHALALNSPDGTPYIITGSLDQVAVRGDSELIVPEIKTTRKTPGAAYYSQFEPGVQLYLYTAVSRKEFAPRRPKIVKLVVQVGVGFAEIHFHDMRIPDSVLREFEREVIALIEEGEQRARAFADLGEAAYPRRITSCHSTPGAPGTPCQFRDICRLAPEDRDAFLKTNYRQNTEHHPMNVKGAA